jgi:hypothetical protein
MSDCGAASRFALILATWLLAGCGLRPDPADTDPAFPRVELELRMDRSVYQRHEPVRMILTVRNPGSDSVAIPFPSSQRYDFRVLGEGGRVLWRWSDGRSFAQVTGEEVLEAGGSVTWIATFEGALEPGEYHCEGHLPDPLDRLRARASFLVR